MTPYEIRVMLHYYYSPEPYPEDSPILATTLQKFVGADLLHIEDNNALRVTDKGRVYCEALIAMPLPRQVWVVDSPDKEP